MSASERVTKWIFFSVVIAIIPLIAVYLLLVIKGQQPGYRDIFGKGELFLIVIALCGAAIGDLVTAQKAKLSTKLISGGLTLVVLLLASLLYAYISSETGPIADVAKDQIALISGALFLIGAFSCGCCIAVAE